MSRADADTVKFKEQWEPETGYPVVGRIVRIMDDGRPLVDYPGNSRGPVEARSIIDQLPDSADEVHPINIPVLLVFDQGDSRRPIVVGLIQNSFRSSSEKEVILSSDRVDDLRVDGNRISFDAKDEIILRCGKSSLRLRRDGKIILKGAQLVSRASGENKIKGASVKIN